MKVRLRLRVKRIDYKTTEKWKETKKIPKLQFGLHADFHAEEYNGPTRRYCSTGDGISTN